MKEAENEDGEGKRKVESLWVSSSRSPIFNEFSAGFQNSPSTLALHLRLVLQAQGNLSKYSMSMTS